MKTVLITGGSGQVGKAILEQLETIGSMEFNGFQFVFVRSREYNLTNYDEVVEMYKKYKPYHVVHCAARVGGITDNVKYPAEYIMQNSTMDGNMLRAALKYDIERFTSILSTCIYPDILPEDRYPLNENDLHDGPPTPTNFQYAYAKRHTAVMIDAINKQFNKQYNYLIPCNLFGKHDKYENSRSHFVAALIKKISEAKKSGADSIQLFGDGTPKRQFILAEDLARIIIKVVTKNITKSFNVASDENYTIDDMATMAIEAVAPALKKNYDTAQPNGQINKIVSNKILKEVLPTFKFVKFKDALEQTYKAYEKQFEAVK